MRESMPEMLSSRYFRIALPFALPLAFAAWASSWEFAVGAVVTVALLCWMMVWFRTWRTAVPGALMIDVIAWFVGALIYLFVHPPD